MEETRCAAHGESALGFRVQTHGRLNLDSQYDGSGPVARLKSLARDVSRFIATYVGSP